MRLTVGPLPPAVYWRRRAMVLGVVLLFVLVVVYSCSGPDKRPVADPVSSRSPEATATIHTPTSESPTSEPSQGSTTGVPAVLPTGASAVPDDTCADTEIKVTPVPSQNPVGQRVTIELRLLIKNISDRTCDRDVGADMQELYIAVGAQKVWSSDVCGTAKGSNVQSFPPGQEHEYRVAWNGRQSTDCTNGVANGDWAKPGEYQLFGRLGTKLSDPVKLTVLG